MNSFLKGHPRVKCRECRQDGFCVSAEIKNIFKETAISPDFCIQAFHSAYPYLLTLANGGWFNWVRGKGHVIVNCPWPGGVAMRVKAASADKPGLLEIEIMQESFLFKAQPFKRNDGLVKDVLTRRLKGKSALITGASRGVGREIALMLAPYEMRLGLLARSREELDKLAEEIKKFGSQAIILAVDLTERPQIEQAVALFAQKAGAPDFLVNNAGIGMRSYWEDITLEKELAITGVNYLAPLILMRLILPMMLKRKSGQIININTVGGLYAAPYQAAYCASKAAFLAYATSLAHELEGSGVYISNLFPGPIDTEFLRRPNYESFRDSKEVVPAGRVASEVMAVIARPRERVFIGPAWRHLAVKLTNLAPCLFRRIIESKNSLPLRVKKKDA